MLELLDQFRQVSEKLQGLELSGQGRDRTDRVILQRPPPDSPTVDLGSLASDKEEATDDFRTSVSDSLGDKSAHHLPPLYSTPATKLPDFEVRLSLLHSPESSPRSELPHSFLNFLTAIQSHDPVQVSQLLSHVSDPNLPDPLTGQTALHMATESASMEICVLLLDYGQCINVNVKDRQGRTPLHIATDKGEVEIAALFMRSGADVDVVDSEGNTALHLAARNDNANLVASILRRNPSLGLRNKRGLRAFDVAGFATAVLLRAAENRKIRHKPSIPCSVCSQIPIKPSPDDFELLGLLGKGSFGEVFLVKRQNDSEMFAMKVLRKEKIMNQNLVKYAMTERNVLSVVRHPFIVSLRAAFQTADLLYLLLDYCPGGDMGYHLSHEKRFSEHRARIYASEVLLALEELHKRDIIFRDLKPDNVVFDGNGHALLTDFGLSKEGIQANDSARSFCGSLAYLAPEVLRREGHGKAVDWYLLGVLIYEMLVGSPPYFSRSREQLFHNIQYGELHFPHSLSTEAKALISAVISTQLLERNPRKRLGSGVHGSEDIKNHAFFTGVNWAAVYRKELRPPVLQQPLLRSEVERKLGDTPAHSGTHFQNWTFVSQG